MAALTTADEGTIRRLSASAWARMVEHVAQEVASLLTVRFVQSVNSDGTVTVESGNPLRPDPWKVGIASGLTCETGDQVVLGRVDGQYKILQVLSSTLSPLSAEAVVDAVAAALVAGSGATIIYDDAAGTITITATGGGGGAFAAYEDTTLVDGSVTKLRAWEGIVATLAATGDVRFSALYAGSGGNWGTSSALSRVDQIKTIAEGGTGAVTAGAARTALGVAIGADVQAWDVFLDQIAALTDPNADRILFWDDSLGAFTWLTLGTNLTITGTTLDAAGGGGVAVQEDTTPVVTATTIQAWEGLLATNPSGSIARITVLFAGSGGNFGTASSVARSDHLHAQADIANLVTDLSNKQPLDADLTTIAGLTATTDNVIQSVGGNWASRTPAQLKSTLALVKGDVGLGSVDNTSDAGKPVSTAQQTALDLKRNESWFKSTRITPQTTITSSTAANVASGSTNMAFAVNAGEIWQFEFVVFFGVNNTGGVKFQFTCPTGYGLQAEAFGTGASLTAVMFDRMDTASVLTTAFHTFNNAEGMVRITGTLTNTGGGTLQLQYAAGVNGQTVTLNAGSYFIANRIA